VSSCGIVYCPPAALSSFIGRRISRNRNSTRLPILQHPLLSQEIIYANMEFAELTDYGIIDFLSSSVLAINSLKR
jgi:hypothetical protein